LTKAFENILDWVKIVHNIVL